MVRVLYLDNLTLKSTWSLFAAPQLANKKEMLELLLLLTMKENVLLLSNQAAL
jgi:hypothetical protein